MLSYQHAFHAGNLADVHKHALLAFTLNYLIQKNKPLTYIETHAGRGLYRLTDPEALKTGEAAKGILSHENRFPKAHPYPQILAQTRAKHGLDSYPGSPMIAALSLREDDRIHLAELHPQEHEALVRTLAAPNVTVHKRDGFDLAQALTPPTPRRGVLLCDPSYEVKQDYDRIPIVFSQIARKWNVGTLILWYPILRGHPHKTMIRKLEAQHEAHLTHEVTFPPAREGHRMEGSGMFFVNPPFGLDAETERLTALYRDLA